MSEYEITYLTSPQLTDEARGELDGAVDATIDRLAGSISFTEPSNRRRLFYPIKKQSTAFSRTVNVTLDPGHIFELKDTMKKQAGVLRVTVLKTQRREEVTPTILDDIYNKATPVKATGKPSEKKPAKPVTMAEVEERIEEALDEEVK